MKEYHKIQSVFLRDTATKMRNFLMGQWTLPEFEYLKDNEWIWTEKVDGTNIRIMWNGKQISFGGKTDNAQIPSFLVNKLNQIFLPLPKRQKFLEVFKNNLKDVCLYGEGYGDKIQSVGKNYIKGDNDFILFDIKIGGVWLKREDIEDIAKKLGIGVVPIVGKGTLTQAIDYVAKGFNSAIGNCKAEGLVMRPRFELMDRLGQRIITKVKTKDFIYVNDK